MCRMLTSTSKSLKLLWIFDINGTEWTIDLNNMNFHVVSSGSSSWQRAGILRIKTPKYIYIQNIAYILKWCRSRIDRKLEWWAMRRSGRKASIYTGGIPTIWRLLLLESLDIYVYVLVRACACMYVCRFIISTACSWLSEGFDVAH